MLQNVAQFVVAVFFFQVMRLHTVAIIVVHARLHLGIVVTAMLTVLTTPKSAAC